MLTMQPRLQSLHDELGVNRTLFVDLKSIEAPANYRGMYFRFETYPKPVRQARHSPLAPSVALPDDRYSKVFDGRYQSCYTTNSRNACYKYPK
jgi:hypothetical protein